MPSRPRRRIEVTVAEQRLRLIEGDAVLLWCAISTSKYGLGNEPGSNRTPLGRFRIAEKHGADAPYGTIFKSRQPVGLWDPQGPVLPDDLITTRILWLEGLEKGNSNSYERFIYIHGTNQEHRLGTTASHGCVRMANRDVMALFDAVDVGTPMTIA